MPSVHKKIGASFILQKLQSEYKDLIKAKM